ncbi:MAG: hypothetical protein UV94_C0008G0013 [Parcubacteria group bacterium GW2011_GWC1_43_30]|nr:MAG: hypothetical protein UV94_C0008G0013 [Parcubacteria group bacterium GW2011_GWC1_43_30]
MHFGHKYERERVNNPRQVSIFPNISVFCASKRNLHIILLSLLLLLWFTPASSAWAAAFTSKATGNWSASGQTTWNEAGVPGDGDTVSIAGAHTITIDQNIGTNGNGIKQIILNHASARLQFSNAGSAYTIYFASTGTDPLGGGTNTNPTFASASMFGFFVARGTLALDGDATHIHTITSGNDTNPIYIHHNWGDLGNYTGANLSLTYTIVKHLGTNVGGMQGIFWRGETGFTFVVDHSQFDDPYSVVYNAAGLAPTFTFNYISNARSHTLDFTNGVVRAPGLIITDNTEVTPAASDKAFLYALSGSGASGVGITFQRNALLANITSKKLIHTQAGSLNGSGGHHNITDNVAVSTGSDGIGINTLMTDTELNVYRNVLDGYYQGITQSSESGNIYENMFFANSGSVAGQGQIITYGYASGLTIHHNVFAFSSLGADQIALFLFKSGGLGDSGIVKHNTIYTAAIGGGTPRAILIGESGYYNTNSIVRDNLVTGPWSQGIADGNGAGSTNTYVSDYAGSGVHHNAVQGASTGWKNNGGTNFTDGTNAHPNAVYGDVTTTATFVDATRTLLTFDTSLGGAGTYANLFSNLANRCGCTGTAWNSAYNLDQTGGLQNYLMSGWKPTNTAFQVASDNMSPSNGWIGAIEGDAPSTGGTLRYVPAPIVTLSVDTASITQGQSSTLTWSVENASNCWTSGGWSDAIDIASASTSSKTVTPTSTTPYTLACFNEGGLDIHTVMIEVDKTIPVATITSTISVSASSTLPLSEIKLSSSFVSPPLKLGMRLEMIKYLQTILNTDPDTSLAKDGPGSPGNETDYFGPLTKKAVIKFQEKYAEEVLLPWQLTKGTGFVGTTTRAKLNQILGR